jgi:hypothetical protein
MFRGEPYENKAPTISSWLSLPLSLGAATLTGAPAVSANPNVGGNNSIAAYVGTGGLLLARFFLRL